MVEMATQETFWRFRGGTGGSVHRTEITDKSNRRTHIGNLTLLIVSLLETIPFHSKVSARIKKEHQCTQALSGSRASGSQGTRDAIQMRLVCLAAEHAGTV